MIIFDLLTKQATSKDYVEDFKLENGMYTNRCCACGEMFIGYKRRVICKSCFTIENSTTTKDYNNG